MRDPILEARLTREGVSYAYREALPLTSIDVAGSLRNQARFDPINKTNVERYALKMIDGEAFPPLIVFPVSKDLLRVVDGNHRVAAATEAEIPALDAYVLENPDALTITRLTRTWNIANGAGLSPEDIIEQAVYLCRNTPYSQRDVARMVGMKENTLSNHLRGREAKERLFGMGVPAEGLSISHATILGTLREDAVLAEAARLVIRTNMSAPRLQQLVLDARKGASEADRLAVVKGWQTRLKGVAAVTGGGRYVGPTKRDHVIKLLNALHKVSHLIGREGNAAAFGLVLREDVESVRVAYTEAANRLRRLLDSATAASQRVS